ncbi:hypothetical protein SHKM778_82800 [Streptomyces sp. KM77-8]|uniref:HNH nuclease domain-containing protein n=1 Tax=Streptomyces haneummycinicus TaxID=3074435 RepID=A0AAT9HWY6_9ACTN
MGASVYTRERLEEAARGARTLTEALVRLGWIRGAGTNISRRIKAYGIDTSHFTPAVRTERQRHNQRRRTAAEILVEDTSDHARRIPGSRLKRVMRELGMEERCALCGIEPVWLGEPLPLEVGHIDGNWRNNRIENLRTLCPNCHSMTDGYRGRGKGRAS